MKVKVGYNTMDNVQEMTRQQLYDEVNKAITAVLVGGESVLSHDGIALFGCGEAHGSLQGLRAIDRIAHPVPSGL